MEALREVHEMKAYIQQYKSFAGRWIYQGYRRAWDSLGYDLHKSALQHEPGDFGSYIPCTKETLAEEYIIMSVGECVLQDPFKFLEAALKSHKSFIHVQPHAFPDPWGRHRNFVSRMPNEIIEALRNLPNVHFWAFSDAVDIPGHYDKWKKVNCIPLAFDSIGYKPTQVPKYQQFDVSFVGGWANNGFDEKRKIIIETFTAFKDSGLKCGFFVNKGLTHDQECALLANSKITLNIHDAYQRILGHDTNERTFKSLGLNGALVSDSVTQLNRLFPNIQTSSDAFEMVDLVKQTLSLSEKELMEMKEKNKQDILANHCYTNRVEKLLSL